MSDIPGPANRDFTDDDLRAALGVLSEEPNWARVGVTQRARVRRRNRRVVATGLVAALGLGAFGVVATRDRDHTVPLVTEPSGTTTTTAAAVDSADGRTVVWPEVIRAGSATEVTGVVVNDGHEVVIAGCRGGELRVAGSTLEPKWQEGKCAGEWVLPGEFSAEFTWRVPPLPTGVYEIDGATLVAADESAYRAIEPSDDRVVFTDRVVFAGADLLAEPRVTIPDEIVVLGGNRLALSWSTACNRPGFEVAFAYRGASGDGTLDTIAVELRTAHFVTTDCLGEPDNWATVIDLPAPLRGARVIATMFDPGPGADAAVVAATRVDAWPVGEPLPALVTMDREPLSLLDPVATDDAVTSAVSARLYDGCGAWVARPIVDGGTMYLQAYVPADNEPCSDNPTPQVGFTVEPGTLPNPFGGNSYLIDP